MKHFLFFIALIISTGISKVHAQSVPESLNNAKIVSMIKGGLPKSVIVKSIDTKPGNFDTSTDALLSLKKQGVPDDVIEAMMNKGSGTSETHKDDGGTLKGNLLAVNLINQPYYFTGSGYRPLEKGLASQRAKKKLLGYGGVDFQYELPGASSAVKLPQSDSTVFVINTGSAAPELYLYKLKVDGNQRVAVGLSFSSFGKTKAADNVVATNIIALKPGYFKVVVPKKLETGEYFFSAKPASSATTADVYTFNVQ